MTRSPTKTIAMNPASQSAACFQSRISELKVDERASGERSEEQNHPRTSGTEDETPGGRDIRRVSRCDDLLAGGRRDHGCPALRQERRGLEENQPGDQREAFQHL